MKFIVSSSILLKQLQQISGVINANTVLPILEFPVQGWKNKLTVLATDLETVMKVQEMEVEERNQEGFASPQKSSWIH
jgi:DNA polymerase-3 subunit beta